MLERVEKNANGKSASKREKFVHLAEARTKNAIKAIRIIAKLGNKNAYDFSEADVKKIASALTKEIDAMRSRMSHAGGKDVVGFEL
jgi:ribosomal protein L7/L12